MSNTDSVRWRQRLESFEAAMRRLDDACDQEQYSELEMAGLIQTYEFSFELAWKTLKDLLFVEGIDAKSPRQVLREAHDNDLLDDIDLALEALESRNRLSHTYSEEEAQEAVKLIKDIYAPLLTKILETLRKRRESE